MSEQITIGGLGIDLDERTVNKCKWKSTLVWLDGDEPTQSELDKIQRLSAAGFIVTTAKKRDRVQHVPFHEVRQ